MIKTEQQTTDRSLQDALLGAAYGSADVDSVSTQTPALAADTAKKPWNPRNGEKRPAVSPLNGQPVPVGGKPVGTKNKLTNLREAVLGAFDKVGGMEYLARLAEGTQSDRAAFVGLVSKVLPTQINANVEGGIQIQLSWLGGRAIGTTTAQQAEVITQVVDLEQDPAGKYRIRDQAAPAQPAADAAGTPAGQGAGGANDA